MNNQTWHSKSTDLITPISQSAVFYLYLVLSIPSVPCSIFLLIRIIQKRTILAQIANHIIVAVLSCSFIQVILELPIVLYNLRTGTVFIKSDIFCKFWGCLDYSCNVGILMLMAFGSVERHFLVFYRPVLNAHPIILHYIPLALCIIYPTVLYTYLIFFYPCVNEFNFSMITCGGPCYYFEAALSTFDQFANIFLPIKVATIANIALIVRVLHQKRRMKQQRMWKKNRRLVAELLSFVILHNIVWLPMLITSLMMFYSPSRSIILVQLNINILPYGIYVVILLCPFLLAMGLVDVWPRKVSDWFRIKLWNNTVRTEPVR